MRQIALLMLLIGVATTTARADVAVEKWHVWYTNAKSAEYKADFDSFAIPTSDGTHKFSTGITESKPGAKPIDKITADVTVVRHGQTLDISWETHDPSARKSWGVKTSGPITIMSANKFEGHLVGGDPIYGMKE